MAGAGAEQGPVDPGLRMFDAEADGEGLGLDVDAALVKRLESVAGGVADGQHHLVGLQEFAGVQAQAAQHPRPIGDAGEFDVGDAVAEAGMMNDEYGWEELPGEGAFYAPKLEWHLTDAIGRTWQVGTIQGDRVLPERLDASYIGEDGEKHRPVMLHRAIFGSYERFIGILIEHFAGKLPVWLAPTQAVVATIVSDADDYASEALAKLRAAGIRAESDLRNEKINYKVREHSLAKVPHLLVVGKREAEEGTVAVRTLGEREQRVMSLDEAIAMLRDGATPPDMRD